jgi:N-acetylglucosamine-6-phosphate deacetylase
MPHLIHTERLFDGEKIATHHSVLIEEGVIQAVAPRNQLPDVDATSVSAGLLTPGLIDLQVNGGGGALLNNDLSRDGLQRILRAHRLCGTTGLLATLISDSQQVLSQGLQLISAAYAAGEPGLLGGHLEGPFFNPARAGVHRAAHLRSPTAEDLAWLCQDRSFPLLITLAPDVTTPDYIAQLSSAGITVWAGHSDATYDQARAGLRAGVNGFTHLFNAMSPMLSRAPGMVGAALEDDHSWLGVIADGHHVHPAVLRVAWRAKPRGKLCLVSDAMATVGSTSESFTLYDEQITLRDGVLRNAQGNLAGSAICLLQAVAYCHSAAGIELEECLRMASLYPATALGLDAQYGRIAPGYRADLIHFDSDFRVTDSWLAGEHLHHAS